MATAQLNTRDLAHCITLEVKFKSSTQWVWRLKIASWLIRLAAWVAWVNVSIEIED